MMMRGYAFVAVLAGAMTPSRLAKFIRLWASAGFVPAVQRARDFFRTRQFGGSVQDRPAVYTPAFTLLEVCDPAIFDDPHGYGRRRKPARGAPLVWYAPNWLYWWGGGIYTIIRFAHLLSQRGQQNILYIYNNEGYPTEQKLRSDLDDAYPGHDLALTTDIASLPEGHIAIATTHQSVFSVLQAPPPSERFYFMQEYESLLYPGGTRAEQANASYRLGFKGICGGDWLKSIFEQYGGKAIKFDFAVDRDTFYCNQPLRSQVERLFFFGRPSSDRRMYELGVAALQAIHRAHPQVEIVVAGLDDLATLPFPATYLGNVPIKRTGDLYRSCDVGLALSGSNLSYLPVELMACGVPVLTNSGPQSDWYCKHLENSYTCLPFVSHFERGFGALHGSIDLRRGLRSGGLASVARTTWEAEADKILRHICAEAGWTSDTSATATRSVTV